MQNEWNIEFIKKQIRMLKGDMLMKHMKHMPYLENQLDIGVLEALIYEDITPHELLDDFKSQLREDIFNLVNLGNFMMDIDKFSRLNRFIDKNNLSDLMYREYNLDEFHEIMNEVFKIDKTYLKIFNNIYKENKNNLKFTEERCYSIYIDQLKYSYINIELFNNIEDVFNITHEYAHSISDSIRYHRHSDEYPFVELLPAFIFFITRDELLKNKKLAEDVTNVEATEFCVHNTYARELVKECIYLTGIESNQRRRDVIKYISKKYNKKKTDIMRLFEQSTLEKLVYVIPYLVALELYNEYKFDKESAIYKLNKIITLDDNLEDYYKELKDLNINLNNTSEEYIKDLNKRLIKK